ncbi:MAG: hypothetical protein RLZZ182_39, partial [Pseudomonadota bacterium]
MAAGVALVAAVSLAMLAWSHRQWEALQADSLLCQQQLGRTQMKLQAAELGLNRLAQGD